MNEPLDPEVKESWIELLDRFENVIYPELFKDRGYTKAAALQIWSMNKWQGQLSDLLDEIKEKFE